MPDTLSLPEVVNSLDDLHDRVRQFYDRDESGAYRLTSIDGLKNAKFREKEEKKQWKEKALRWEGKFNGMDEQELEELIQYREDRKNVQQRELEEKRQWEALKQQMEDNHRKQIETKAVEAKRNWDLLEQYVRNDHLRSALEERGATETGKRILPELLARRVQLSLTEEGQPTLVFFDQNGKQIHVNGKNEDYTINDFMEEVYHNYDDLFVGANKSGTGATITARHAARQNMLPSKMSDREKAAFISQYGEESYRNLLQLEIQKRRESQGAN